MFVLTSNIPDSLIVDPSVYCIMKCVMTAMLFFIVLVKCEGSVRCEHGPIY